MDIVSFILIFIVGSAAIFCGIKFSKFNNKVRKWPSVKGQLYEKRLGTPKNTMADTPDDMSIFAKYSYHINNIEYQGENVYALELMKGERTALSKSAIKKMQLIENTPTVYYNPADPTESFLLFDRMWISSGLLIVGILLILFSFLFLVPS